jgi:hypothetical protein
MKIRYERGNCQWNKRFGMKLCLSKSIWHFHGRGECRCRLYWRPRPPSPEEDDQARTESLYHEITSLWISQKTIPVLTELLFAFCRCRCDILSNIISPTWPWNVPPTNWKMFLLKHSRSMQPLLNFKGLFWWRKKSTVRSYFVRVCFRKDFA